MRKAYLDIQTTLLCGVVQCKVITDASLLYEAEDIALSYL